MNTTTRTEDFFYNGKVIPFSQEKEGTPKNQSFIEILEFNKVNDDEFKFKLKSKLGTISEREFEFCVNKESLDDILSKETDADVAHQLFGAAAVYGQSELLESFQ